MFRPILTATALAVGLLSGAGAALAQDAANGETVFKKCAACHRIGEGAKNLVGPQLNGIVGRKAGTVEGFNYSEANKKKAGEGLVWTEDVLFKYLENPVAFMPGTKMSFAGVKDEADRKDVIAYLKKFQ
jgi:cytochrome c